MKQISSLLFKIPSRNIIRNAHRSIAALISIAAGFAALNLFEGYIGNAEHMFEITYSQRLMYGDFLIHRSHAFSGGLSDDPKEQLSLNDQKQIRTLVSSEAPEIDTIVPFLNFSGLVSNGLSSTVLVGYAYDLAAGEKMRGAAWHWNTLAGHPLETDSSEPQMLIGRGLGRMMECRPTGQPIAMSPAGGYPPVVRPFSCPQPELQISTTSPSGQMTAGNFRVTGIIDAIYREVDMRNVVLPLDKAQHLLGTENITFFSSRVSRGTSPASVIKRLNSAFEAKGLPFTAVAWQKHPYGEIYVQSMNFLGVFRTFTVLVVLAIVTLSVLSTFLRLVHERTREIGTLRCLGFRASQILAMFMSEVFLIATIGNTIGLVFSVIISRLLNHAGILYQIGILSERVPFQIDLSGRDLGLAALLLTVLSLTAGAIATIRALRLKIPSNLEQH